MNKKLMAVAVAGALTAPGLAVAQVGGSPGVSLYGRVDTGVMIQKFSSDGTGAIPELKKNDIFSPGNAIGVRGREDLGGGTAAWFQLESGAWPDGRLENTATNGAHFGGRNSAVGFSSAAGDVLFGIWDSPYKVAYGTANLVTSGGFASSGIIMGNGDTTGALPNAQCANGVSNSTGSIVTGANGVCVTESTGNGTSWSRRNNNSIQYWSPVLSGVQFRLGTALANYQSADSSPTASGVQKAKYYSGNVTYARGPLALAAGYESHEGFRPGNTAAGTANPKDNAFQIGGKWDFGLGQVGAGYEQLKYDDNGSPGGSGANANQGGMKVPSWVVNGRINAGPGAVWGSYNKSQGGKSCSAANMVIGNAACGVQVKMFTVGYDYIMSKRTKMYVAYNKIDNGWNGTVGSNYYYIAGPAAQGNAAGRGTSGALIAGTDVTTIGLGIQHSF